MKSEKPCLYSIVAKFTKRKVCASHYTHSLCACYLIYLQQNCEKVHANILILNVKKIIYKGVK